jgi:hypothetical protein
MLDIEVVIDKIISGCGITAYKEFLFPINLILTLSPDGGNTTGQKDKHYCKLHEWRWLRSHSYKDMKA